MIKNKRADISITILVLGVFAICAIAIISFVIVGSKAPSTFSGPAVIDNVSASLQNFYFYVNAGYSMQVAANMVGGQLSGNQLVLGAQQYPDSILPVPLTLINKNQKPILSVQYFVNLN